jgi:UDP-glucose:(heptosyl)LPS alpha-1,3-glucosyltransferase
MTMSKIALVKYRFLGKQGGLEKQAFKIIDELLSRGHEVTLISSQTINYKSIESIKLKITAPKGFLTLLQFDNKVKKYLKNNHFDSILALDRTSIHTHIRAGNGCHAAYLNLRKERVNLFKELSFSLNPLHLSLLHLEKKGFTSSKLKKIFVNSELVKNQILSTYKIDLNHIEVIHNGVDWHDKDKPFSVWQDTKDEWIHKLKLNPKFLTCVFVGHDFKRKGLEFVLNALPHAPHVQLLVIGQDKNIQKYIERTKKLEIKDRVTFLDCFTDVTPFYALADALILPTTYDPFANVTLEALCMGTQVITSSTNGASEIIAPFAGKTFDMSIATETLITVLQSLDAKTKESANKIRQSVKHLDDSSQLFKLIDILCS